MSFSGHLGNVNVEDLKESEDGSESENDEVDLYKDMNHAGKLYFLDALYQLGWKPEVGKRFTTKDVLNQLNLPEQHIGFCHFFLRKFEELGYLRRAKEPKFSSKFWFIEKPPTRQQISEFHKETVIPLARYSTQVKMLKDLGVSMKGILTGEISPLSVIFPVDYRKANLGDALKEVVKLEDSAKGAFYKTIMNPKVDNPIIGNE